MSTFNPLSSNMRKEVKSRIQNQTFDLLVIGGGATGAGIALDAASRGLKTVLVEKDDFAAGTSSKSTKLIHGGLRYLKQLDIGLVRETGTERAIVHKLAPHLILPEKMILPLIEGGTYGKWATSFGLKVYDILAGVKGDDRRKMLSKKATLKLEPLIDEKLLKGSGFYAEYRTDDARLTIELIKTACRFDALPINYVKANEFLYDKEKIAGAKCTDMISGEEIKINASVVVAAGGPWVDKIRKKDNSLKGKRLHLTKGVHVVVPHEKFPIKYTVYFDVPDGRMLFAVPRGRVTYIGTTDTNYKGNLNRIVATKADAKYILDSIKSAFPSIDLKFEDLISSWAGLRPLIHEDGKSPSELSRKDEIFESESGLIAIAGGKLTGYRKMAQRIVDKVSSRISSTGKAVKKCQTRNLGLTKKVFNSYAEVKSFIKKLEVQTETFGLDKYFAWYLTTNYGYEAETILNNIVKYKNTPEIALTRAELAYCLEHEMVQNLADFYVRRTGKLYFEIENIEKTISIISEDLASFFSWTNQEAEKYAKDFDQEYQDARTYYDQDFA